MSTSDVITPARAVIRIEQLFRTYVSGDVSVKAVRGVNLKIHRGEFVALMGASGSGKSTLMNTLGCLDRPTSGAYFLEETEVGRLSARELAQVRSRKIGFVFQNFNLLARTTALENVELPLLYTEHAIPRTERKRRAMLALERVNLGGRHNHYATQLSGGQQQRVAIARALVNEPELVLADEPTGNLDSQTSIEIMTLFQELNRSGMTIVMVTHELDMAAYCKRRIVMRDGLVVEDSLNSVPRIASDDRERSGTAEGEGTRL